MSATYSISVSSILIRCIANTEIISAPSSNVTVPLNRATTVNFTCRGRGAFVYWNVNGEKVITPGEYHNPNVEIHQDTHSGRANITIAITVNYATNNTRLRCEARQLPPNPNIPDEDSDFVTLTIAGKINHRYYRLRTRDWKHAGNPCRRQIREN